MANCCCVFFGGVAFENFEFKRSWRLLVKRLGRLLSLSQTPSPLRFFRVLLVEKSAKRIAPPYRFLHRLAIRLQIGCFGSLCVSEDSVPVLATRFQCGVLHDLCLRRLVDWRRYLNLKKIHEFRN
jgi:hypothetical protein